MKSKKSIWKIVLCILALLIIVSIVHNIIKNKKVTTQSDVKNVSVVKASLASISTTVNYSGQLTSDKEISVSPKVPGKVSSLNVKVGSKVNAGDVLFTLDSSSLNAQLKQQQANVDSANATLDKTKSSGLEQQLIQAEQSVKSSSINYNDAKTNYDRIQKLYSAGAATKQELDSAKTKLDSASSSLSSAQQNLNLIKEKIGPESIEVAEAQLKQAQAALESIKVQIEDNIVKSPVSGTVSAVNIDVGEMSSSTQPCITIVKSDSIIAKISVPDTMLSKIKVGQSLKVVVPSLSDKNFTGTISVISPDVDSTTQQYTVKIKLDNSNGDLKPGMFAKISLPDESKKDVIAVPNQAIRIENGVSYLYIVKNNKVQKISVDTGISNGTLTEVISSKIKVGDNIIDQGQTFLNNGDAVKIIN
ncbi:efflux RND transporter periplasmic adaptor subunit [Clostridium sp. cel8]|jgi:HlyD family secretion protein|uniref:efflux RND transporter periplasmic adaptor subunit n=1 Tax=unclassified Clostridium TaxID=2614128 RepID=UPI0015F56AA1|nr:efflux RND transporter periplasmic adaptor subunit [Clostridium sp. cel8]MBA5852018.1 efflux RND transporter periplasmic adaptor subunit [Clostridium sp. cel8]